MNNITNETDTLDDITCYSNPLLQRVSGVIQVGSRVVRRRADTGYVYLDQNHETYAGGPGMPLAGSTSAQVHSGGANLLTLYFFLCCCSVEAAGTFQHLQAVINFDVNAALLAEGDVTKTWPGGLAVNMLGAVTGRHCH